jgi:hypothetical protein
MAPVPTYSPKDLKRIATALGVSAADVVQHRTEFEAAARWYRLNVPSAKRQEGPTLELRNQRPKKSKEPSTQSASEKPKTLSDLRKKATQVEAAAKKLLLHLGVRHPEEAPDGPGDRELLIFLASYGGLAEEEIIEATARIGRLAKLSEAIGAAKTLKACACKATQEAVYLAYLLPKGHLATSLQSAGSQT